MKFAICHELFENISWAEQCRIIAALGYQGIEVAPFTISDNLAEVPDAVFDRMRREAEEHGLEVIGLHWLLARTKGLHLTSPDPAVRAATADYLRLLGRVCHRLGGKILVFGSPAQRNLVDGVSTEEGMRYAAEVFREVLPALQSQSVQLCVEPLTAQETNFLNTCDEAMQLIRMVGHPALRLHQDVKAMLGAEARPLPALIHEYHDFCGHFHVNDSNLLGPGMGPTDFHPIVRALLDSDYRGWVSVEVFDYRPGAEHIAAVSLQYMQRVLSDLQRGDGGP